jgi:hypothetical protein
MMTAIAEQLENGISSYDLMGFLDAPKLISNVELFERISRENVKDDDLNSVCIRALKILKNEKKSKKSRFYY